MSKNASSPTEPLSPWRGPAGCVPPGCAGLGLHRAPAAHTQPRNLHHRAQSRAISTTAHIPPQSCLTAGVQLGGSLGGQSSPRLFIFNVYPIDKKWKAGNSVPTFLKNIINYANYFKGVTLSFSAS